MAADSSHRLHVVGGRQSSAGALPASVPMREAAPASLTGTAPLSRLLDGMPTELVSQSGHEAQGERVVLL